MVTIDPEESELRLLSNVASTSVEVPNQKYPHSITGWSHQAVKLRSNACSDKLSTSVDLILACVPLAFLGRCLCVCVVLGFHPSRSILTRCEQHSRF